MREPFWEASFLSKSISYVTPPFLPLLRLHFACCFSSPPLSKAELAVAWLSSFFQYYRAEYENNRLATPPLPPFRLHGNGYPVCVSRSKLRPPSGKSMGGKRTPPPQLLGLPLPLPPPPAHLTLVLPSVQVRSSFQGKT